MGIRVTKSGLQTLVMDQGRKSTRALGIPACGAIDLFQYWWACGLVGHFDFRGSGPPVLEMAAGGVEIQFEHAHRFALTGSSGHFMLDGMRLSRHTVYFAQKGQHLQIKSIDRNGTVYAAIDGSWNVDKVYGSASTDILSPFPGTCGNILRKNTPIEILPQEHYFSHKRGSPKYIEPIGPLDRYTLRLTAGPELNWVELPKHAFTEVPFLISRASNRMGFRLETDLNPDFRNMKMISSFVVPGTIQWPVGGKPILLLPNCQTTGGYPRIGAVIDADMWKLAYIGPGDEVNFKWVTRDEALYLRQYQMGQFSQAWDQTFKNQIRNHLLMY